MSLADILTPRTVQIGCIKIGRKEEKARRTNDGREWYAPEKLDNFLVTSMNRDGRGQLLVDKVVMDELAKTGYADPDGKLRRIPIRVLSNDPEDIMAATWCWYAGRHIGARSDGKNVTWFVGNEKKNWRQLLPEPVTEPWTPKWEDWADTKGNKFFKRHVVFNAVVACSASRFGGVHKFRTTSSITGDQLYGGLVHILTLTNGILMGMPLELVVRPMQVSPTVDNKQITSTVYVVHVELIGSDLQAIQELAMKQAKFQLSTHSTTTAAIQQYRAMLRAPGHETNEREILDISDEFHPEVEDKPEVKMPQSTDDPEPEPEPPAETPQVEQPAAETETTEPPAEREADPDPEDESRAKAAGAVCKMMREAGDEETLKTAYGMLPKGFTKTKDAHTQSVADVKDECKLRIIKDEIDSSCEAFDEERRLSILKSAGCKDWSEIDSIAKAQKVRKAFADAVNTEEPTE